MPLTTAAESASMDKELTNNVIISMNEFLLDGNHGSSVSVGSTSIDTHTAMISANSCAKNNDYDVKISSCPSEFRQKIALLVGFVGANSQYIDLEVDNSDGQTATDDGEISLEVTEQPSNSEFKIGTAPAFEFQAYDSRDVEFKERFYGSDLSIEVVGPEGSMVYQKGKVCDKQQTRSCDMSLNMDSDEFIPMTQGEYTFNANAEAADGAVESISRTYSTFISGVPSTSPDLSNAGLDDWTPEWEMEDESGEKLWFAVNDQNNLVVDTAGTGICGKALIKKDVTVPSGSSKQISFQYKLSAERLAGKVGIWSDYQNDLIDPEENYGVSRTDKWYDWSINIENSFDREITQTVELGLKDGDDHCGLMSTAKGVRLEIKGENIEDSTDNNQLEE